MGRNFEVSESVKYVKFFYYCVIFSNSCEQDCDCCGDPGQRELRSKSSSSGSGGTCSNVYTICETFW